MVIGPSDHRFGLCIAQRDSHAHLAAAPVLQCLYAPVDTAFSRHADATRSLAPQPPTVSPILVGRADLLADLPLGGCCCPANEDQHRRSRATANEWRIRSLRRSGMDNVRHVHGQYDFWCYCVAH